MTLSLVFLSRSTLNQTDGVPVFGRIRTSKHESLKAVHCDRTTVGLGLFPRFGWSGETQAQRRPNILFIMSDGSHRACHHTVKRLKAEMKCLRTELNDQDQLQDVQK
jgi:hypothetical protein